MRRTPRRPRRRRSRRLRRRRPARVSAVSSSSTVSSLKDWPAADCATRQLFFRLISLFAAFTRRTLKAWVRKCLSPTDTLPFVALAGEDHHCVRRGGEAKGRSGQQAGQGQGHCVLHTDFLWQRLNDPVIFRGSFRRDQAQCQGMQGASCSASRRVSSGTFPATVLPGENRSLRGAPVLGPTRSSRPPGCPRTLATEGQALGQGAGGAEAVAGGMAEDQADVLRWHVAFDSAAGGERSLRSPPCGRVTTGRRPGSASLEQARHHPRHVLRRPC